MRSTRQMLLALALVLAACSPMVWTNGVPNLDTISKNFLRGGQPTLQGWYTLHQMGVRWVIKLNWNEEGTDAFAESLGMKVFYFGMSPGRWDDALYGPSMDMIDEIIDVVLSILEIDQDAVIYIHCSHGQDRTSLITGAIRIRVMHWKWLDAYKEARRHHFHPALLGLRLRWKDLR